MVWIKKTFFIEDNLPETPLFKVSEDNYTYLYCTDNRDSEEQVLNNFFCAVAAHNYTGVKCEEVFST